VRKPDEPLIAFETVLESTHPAIATGSSRRSGKRRRRATSSTSSTVCRSPRQRALDRGARTREKGKRQQMLGVAVDITERKLAELRPSKTAMHCGT
jgi:hypothetical protein